MIKRIGALVFALTLLFSFAVPVSAADAVFLPDGYTQLEYIDSSGSEYVDIDYRPTGYTRFQLSFQILGSPSGLKYVFGSRSAPSSTDAYYTGVSFTGSTLTFYFGGTSYPFSSVNFNEVLNLSYLDNSIALNGSSVSVSSSSFNSAYSWFLFALNSAGSASPAVTARIYSFDIYESSTLKASLVPASNGTSVGFYDTVRDAFYSNSSSSGSLVGGPEVAPPVEEDTVADVITDLNTQIHDIESAIYDDLHTYSAQVDPSIATNFSGNFLSAMSFISNTWTSAYNQLGDMQVIVTFPLFLAIAMLFIGRMNSVIASGAMKSRKNNDKKGGGDVG